ncbi:MAG: CRISPR-associated ring nuclease [Aggregatilineales bacterium]
MPIIYVATLGQRPEAITVAFDRLNDQYHYEAIAVLHTEPHISGIAQAFADLQAVCAHDYPNIVPHFHEIAYEDGTPLIDISDQHSAEAYHRAVLGRIYQYKQSGYDIHLMVAGGRKAMSIYAMLAASVIFEPPRDKVWTVLSPDTMLAQPGQFHIPPGQRDAVQIVELPLRPARIAPGTRLDALLEQPISRAAAFWAKLTPAERELAEQMRQNPYASDNELGKRLHKSSKTVENQLRGIYDKLVGFLDYGESISNKRVALLDVLRGVE